MTKKHTSIRIALDMKLFLAHTGSGYEGYDVIGVFSTLELAEKAISEYTGCNDGFCIKEIEMDKSYEGWELAV